jgi:VanZ family protein
MMAKAKRPARGKVSWIRAWWPVMLGVAVIALESTAWGGTNYTSGPLRSVYEFVFGPVSAETWENVHHYIRKSGHFIGYGLLCLTWLRAWILTFPRFFFLKNAVLALLCTAVVASCDEFHQSLLPNRGSSPWDVLLDCCGAATMTLIAWLVVRLLRRNDRHGALVH